MKQNITLSIDKELIRKAKILAAHRQTSVSGMLSAELRDIIRLVMKKKQDKQPECFTFSWEGGLAGMKDKYSSLDLQHQANDWR